jgi:uncharacterized protein YabE (DUF348 family)
LLRSVKYGLYGAVLAGLVGGTVAWTNVDKTVNLVVDGQNSKIHTTAESVGDVLKQAGYHADSHDILAPAANVAVHDGSKVVYSRGRLLHLNVDGHKQNIWTTAPTVAAAMAQLGYSTEDFTSVSRSRRLPLSPTDIAVRTPKLVTLVHDGKTQQLTTTDATVGQLLGDLAIPVGPLDRVSMPTSAALLTNARIVLQRVKQTTVTKTSPIPFSVTTKHDSSLTEGTTQVLTAGKDGLAKITYAYIYIDGKLSGKTTLKTVVVHGATSKVIKVGTKAVAPTATASPGSAQAIALGLLKARGWGTDQFNCLVTLWNHESGWRVHAANASGAYGIPQALPGSKMSSAGPDWQNNAETQIKWGLGYISSRYSTPCGAWSLWQTQGWY